MNRDLLDFSYPLYFPVECFLDGDSPRAAPEIKGHHSPKPRWGDAGGAWDKPFRSLWGIPTWEMDRNGLVGGLEHEFYDFPYIYIGNSNPNWLSYFQRVETTNQWWFGKSTLDFWCLQVPHVDDLLTSIFYDIPLARNYRSLRVISTATLQTLPLGVHPTAQCWVPPRVVVLMLGWMIGNKME